MRNSETETYLLLSTVKELISIYGQIRLPYHVLIQVWNPGCPTQNERDTPTPYSPTNIEFTTLLVISKIFANVYH